MAPAWAPPVGTAAAQPRGCPSPRLRAAIPPQSPLLPGQPEGGLGLASWAPRHQAVHFPTVTPCGGRRWRQAVAARAVSHQALPEPLRRPGGTPGEGIPAPGPETSGSGSIRGRFLLPQSEGPEPRSVTTEAAQPPSVPLSRSRLPAPLPHVTPRQTCEPNLLPGVRTRSCPRALSGDGRLSPRWEDGCPGFAGPASGAAPAEAPSRRRGCSAARAGRRGRAPAVAAGPGACSCCHAHGPWRRPSVVYQRWAWLLAVDAS